MPKNPLCEPTPPTPAATTPRARLVRRIRRVAIAGAIGYVLYALALFLMQGSLIYPRFHIGDERGAAFAAGVGGVGGVSKLEREIGDAGGGGGGGGRVHAWLLMPTRVKDEGVPSPLVVFFHGNAESAGSNIGHVRHYRDAGFAVLIPEYRGYAGAAGRPTQAGIVDDAVWFIDAARRDPRVDDHGLVLHGRSLGGGVAAQVAMARSPDALILESSFTSIARFARGKLLPEFLVRSPYRTDRVLPTLECPVLILHGTEDTIIPISHARENARIAKNATLVELPGNHNDFPRDEAAYWRAIDGVLRTITSP